MLNDIPNRFEQVKSVFSNSLGYIQVDMTQGGNIVFKAGRSYSIIMWFIVLILGVLFARWLLMEPEPLDFVHKIVFFSIMGIFAVVLIILFPYLLSPLPYFEIDPSLRQIIIYGGFPRLQRQVTIPLDDIRFFVGYTFFSRSSKTRDGSCYFVTKAGISYPLVARYGSVDSPGEHAKALGYICHKLAILVNENRRWALMQGPKHLPRRGKKIDAEGLLSVSEILYDPESSSTPR